MKRPSKGSDSVLTVGQSQLDIKSSAAGVAGELSNFTRREFTFRGILCYSIEGVLQAVKTHDVATQMERCLLFGVKAKRAGKGGPDWKRDQLLYWNGTPMARGSSEYKAFIEELYNAVFSQCLEFRKSLAASGDVIFTHKIGKTERRETVLTRDEFIGQLNRLRLQPPI